MTLNSVDWLSAVLAKIRLALKYFALVFSLYFLGSILFFCLSGFWLIRDVRKISLPEEIYRVRKSLAIFKLSYVFVSWTKYVPGISEYSNDLSLFIEAGEIAIDASERIARGEINQAMADLEKINEKISTIKVTKYSQEYQIKYALLLDIFKMIKTIPYFTGIDSPRRFMIIFQNDKELRPTGGFMTAYSVIEIKNGRFSPISTEDIYNLDARYSSVIPAPETLVKYLKGPYLISPNLRLRDMNWSPDFEDSMSNLRIALNEIGITNIDGVIAVDTHFLVNILDVLGPVGVPGFGTYSTEINEECKCPQVIHELESFADVEGPVVWDPVSGQIVYQPKNADNRKKIIGPLINSILASAIAVPREKYPLLIFAFFKSLREKHILFYLTDVEHQKLFSSLGLSGKIKDYDGDYLHINDANLGGRKSNLYVTQEVNQEIEVENGEIIKTLTLTYKNLMKHDGWLNSVLPNWVRVYVPKGSELLTVAGLEDKIEPYEDLGKTVFAGYFQLRPEGIAKVSFKYKLPFKTNNPYRLLIQKQPGTDAPLYTILIGRRIQEFNLRTDKEIKIKL